MTEPIGSVARMPGCAMVLLCAPAELIAQLVSPGYVVDDHLRSCTAAMSQQRGRAAFTSSGLRPSADGQGTLAEAAGRG